MRGEARLRLRQGKIIPAGTATKACCHAFMLVGLELPKLYRETMVTAKENAGSGAVCLLKNACLWRLP